ncbi:phospholipid methyltransferase-domain-containing protein [Suillus plorans]|uniref:Phosphatidyl-N-methylethanolamine N-methyltransferase n=1 Tax=Suillus plorans TaxID=116603 RepID=A0A9P7IY90_9AGAM|nr:phospholipid methyltransferase-domain-containing protein [Suillus plorans]KAG1797058.1 phospholipid methyltransferase-domain-containing protein [Suillus plorans]
MDALSSIVNVSAMSLHVSLLAIAFNPTAWNIVAQNEYRNKTITRIFGGNACYGCCYNTCYLLTIMIFSFGMLCDHLYQRALSDQPQVPMLSAPYDILIPVLLFAIGQLFVVTSTWALGKTGTFLGDYFGILMDHHVQGFPFNELRNPMYVGSMMCFIVMALWYLYEWPAGLLVSLYIYIVYLIALQFEGPFTDMIYSKRASTKKVL